MPARRGPRSPRWSTAVRPRLRVCPSGVVITKVDDRPIDGAEALVAAVRSKAPGDDVTLTYTDASGASKTVQVTLGQAQT